MKLSNDQKKLAKTFIPYTVAFIVGTIIFHLIKGDIDWKEILLLSVVVAIVNALVTVFYVIGANIPKK